MSNNSEIIEVDDDKEPDSVIFSEQNEEKSGDNNVDRSKNENNEINTDIETCNNRLIRSSTRGHSRRGGGRTGRVRCKGKVRRQGRGSGSNRRCRQHS